MNTTSFTRVELEYCKEVTRKLIEHPLSKPFLRPVNPELDRAYDYFKIIMHPMDLGTIKKKLDGGEYANATEWISDLKLVWDNAKQYNNDKKSLIHRVAERLAAKCNKICKSIPKDESEFWSLKFEKASNKFNKFIAMNPPEISTVPRLPELELASE